MKKPWQIAILGVSLAGVTAYDLLFFGGDSSPKEKPAQTQTNRPATLFTEIKASNIDANVAGLDPIPLASREILTRKALQAYEPKETPPLQSESSWPEHDPFVSSQAITQVAHVESRAPLDKALARGAPVQQDKKEPMPSLLPEPHFIMNGTMTDRGQILAIINGEPYATGDSLGIWQIAKIDPDYLVLQAGNETRRFKFQVIEFYDASQEGAL